MRSLLKSLGTAVLVALLAMFSGIAIGGLCVHPAAAQTRETADQGKPGQSGAWPVVNSAGTLATCTSAICSGYGAVQCNNVATLLPATVSVLSGRRTEYIQNLGPAPIYIGTTNTVTMATGVQVASNGGWLAIDVSSTITLYCIAAALQVSPADTRYLQLK